MRKFGMILAGLLLASISLFVGARPVSSDVFDSNAQHACYVERSMHNPESVVKHGHVAEIGPNWAYVDYHCCESTSAAHKWYFATLWWNGATTSHDYSSLYLGDCP